MTDRIRSLRRELLAWSRESERDLPWRRTRDPWAVLVSEFMLQQTQVARVVPRYDRFLERFPTAASCAAAPPSAVIELWDGLGYNRRAVHLHRAATELVDRYAGRVPADLDALLSLPGLGPYTARAVLAFAFEEHHGVLDTNVARIVSRAVAGRRLGRPEAQALADELVPPGAAWRWNQAMLDLGATVCTKRSPGCVACPVASVCSWHAAGRPDPDPAEGSAGTSGRQSRFEGSDREGRGRLVAALRAGPLPIEQAPLVTGWPPRTARTERVVADLVADGLVEQQDGLLRLPRT